MARPLKDGFDYYPKDTDLFADRKIKKLIRAFGGDGYMIYDFILCAIYRDKGYFVEWNPDFCFDISHEFNIPEEKIQEAVRLCAEINLFSNELFQQGILTSKGVQSRWLFMNKTSKRSDKTIHIKYRINDINSEETVVFSEKTNNNSEETNDNSGISTQSKVKKEKNNTSDNISVIFDQFRKEYPGTKRGLITELENFLKKNRPETVELLLPALIKEKEHKTRLQESGQFVPTWKNLQTWINQKCWEQEFPQLNGNSQPIIEPAASLYQKLN